MDLGGSGSGIPANYFWLCAIVLVVTLWCVGWLVWAIRQSKRSVK